MQLPEPIRATPDFIYKPYYAAKFNNFILQIGPDVLAVGALPEYPGWSSFSKEVATVWKKSFSSGAIGRVTRIGIRYINCFNFDIFSRINLGITMNGDPIQSRDSYVRTLISGEKFNSTLQVVNNTSFQRAGTNEIVSGSIIDIDTFAEDIPDEFPKTAKKILTEGHNEEKKLFFRLLHDDYIESLNPSY